MHRTPVTSVLQRCDTFVGRTMNWMYDHLRFVPDYRPVILCDELANRNEFPDLEAVQFERRGLMRRLWRRGTRDRMYPADRRWLRDLAPAALHSHFGYVAVEDHAIHQVLQAPWLVGFYGADVYMLGRLPEWRERYAALFERVAGVLPLGPAMAEDLRKLGCPEEKIRIHALGVAVAELPFALRSYSTGRTLRVLFAGTFREKKGIPYVVEAAHLARRSGVRLELHLVGDVGGRPEDLATRDEVFGLIKRHGLDQHVVRHRWLSFEHLLQLALRSHVFVAPSVTARDGDKEGTPFVVQQMMATGMPTISTRHSDIPYVFGAHSDMLVEERDAQAIADRLCSYAESPDRIIHDGKALALQIRTHFDVRECARRLASLYASVGAGSPLAAADMAGSTVGATV